MIIDIRYSVTVTIRLYLKNQNRSAFYNSYSQIIIYFCENNAQRYKKIDKNSSYYCCCNCFNYGFSSYLAAK